jgi:DNA-binding winged helix-turn-helix (wHTH) protein
MVVHRFGDFELDAANRRLFREQKRVRLSDSQSAILAHLVTRAGEVVSKEALIEAAWGGFAISANSLDQSISRVRRILGSPRNGAVYIETLPHRGYRFSAPVERVDRDGLDVSLEAQLQPFATFMEGQAQLDTLDRDAIQHARHAFEHALRQAPGYARAHVGLGMACGLAFEASATDSCRDTAALEMGIHHAQKGRDLAPRSGEAWSTVAFVLGLTGRTTQAIAAATMAVELEPENWRHALRLSYVSWGEERLQSGRRVLALCPGLGLAHWLKTTVFVARSALDAALEEVRLGCAAQDTQQKGFPFPAVGLHLLHGLVLAAQGHLDAAASELTRELSTADCGQLYARECAANTWYALGAVRWRQQRREDAHAAFTRALAIAPCHASAAAALRGDVLSSATAIDAAVGQAIVLARGNRHADAARVYRDGLAQAPPGCAGWLLPAEPTLNPLAHGGTWAEALSLVRARAT